MPRHDPEIRQSRDEDLRAIRSVVERAFERRAEADLVEALLDEPVATISLVAEEGGSIVGHVLFSELGGLDGAMALAPVAVAPERQKRGIGSTLIASALAAAGGKGYRAVFVLGEPAYYGRFGFRAELAAGADVPWKGRYFMAIELVPGALEGFCGPLTYPAAFEAL